MTETGDRERGDNMPEPVQVVQKSGVHIRHEPPGHRAALRTEDAFVRLFTALPEDSCPGSGGRSRVPCREIRECQESGGRL
jgi:hypothetical protein